MLNLHLFYLFVLLFLFSCFACSVLVFIFMFYFYFCLCSILYFYFCPISIFALFCFIIILLLDFSVKHNPCRSCHINIVAFPVPFYDKLSPKSLTVTSSSVSPFRIAATTDAQVPVPQASVSPLPLSHTRIFA